MVGSKWSPGFRRMPPSTRHKKSGLDTETIVYASTQPCTVTVMVRDHDPEQGDGSGPDVYLNFNRQDGTRFSLRLTLYTEAELRAFGTAVVAAVKAALPVVKQRDKEAEEVEQNDEPARYRSYRGDPKVTCNPGKKLPQYLESLHD